MRCTKRACQILGCECTEIDTRHASYEYEAGCTEGMPPESMRQSDVSQEEAEWKASRWGDDGEPE